jgi:hypothetical protein
MKKSSLIGLTFFALSMFGFTPIHAATCVQYCETVSPEDMKTRWKVQIADGFTANSIAVGFTAAYNEFSYPQIGSVYKIRLLSNVAMDQAPILIQGLLYKSHRVVGPRVLGLFNCPLRFTEGCQTGLEITAYADTNTPGRMWSWRVPFTMSPKLPGKFAQERSDKRHSLAAKKLKKPKGNKQCNGLLTADLPDAAIDDPLVQRPIAIFKFKVTYPGISATAVKFVEGYIDNIQNSNNSPAVCNNIRAKCTVAMNC